ncbi:MAG: hypothetical protein C5B50_17595 [Verrucomicrobia bacterium]|nr:MAG: hypothetical protein C5B50_17595 [Verrucomicrobiota bacterium]
METRRALSEILEPSAEFCFGRDGECELIKHVPFNEGVAFLFGGWQMGKTTVLLRVQRNLARRATKGKNMDLAVVPIYLDHEALPPLDSRGICEALLQETLESCKKQISGFKWPRQARSKLTIVEFASELDALFAAYGYIHLRLLFLLDNCKRLARLDPAFVGNLQWLLCTRPSKFRSRVSMIFAGGWEMYSLFVAKISPPRPEVIHLGNLRNKDLRALIESHASGRSLPIQIDEISSEIQTATGGHPGLSRLAAEALIECNAGELRQAIHRFFEMKPELFDRISTGLSDEAKSIQELLCNRTPLSRAEVANSLKPTKSAQLANDESEYKDGLGRGNQWPKLSASRVCDELRFSGIAEVDGPEVRRIGTMYWKWCQKWKGAQAIENLSAQAPAIPIAPQAQKAIEGLPAVQEHRYMFKRQQSGWLLAFCCSPISMPPLRGFELIQYRLQNPHRSLSPVELAQCGEMDHQTLAQNEALAEEIYAEQTSRPKAGPPNVNDKLDPPALQAIQREIACLEDEIEQLEAELDGPLGPEQAEKKEAELNEKKDDLEKYRKRLNLDTFSGQTGTFTTDFKKAYTSVRAAMGRALALIRKESSLREMASHFRASLTYEHSEYRYTPAPKIPWQF